MENAHTMNNQHTVAVLGGGSFGTALANIIAANGHHTTLWMRDEKRVEQCRADRENRAYLPGYALHESLIFSADLELALHHADIVVVSIPSQSFREVARLAAEYVLPNANVVSTTKGIELESFSFMSDILNEELPGRQIGVLSGPNFAKEIVKNQYTGTVIASDKPTVIAHVQTVFSSDTFRVYGNADVFGVELGGALKNIYAIITGMAAALGCEQNTLAMLLTRSLAEMRRFAQSLGADPQTFLGLSGVGDLILTCTSPLSRNYRVGFSVGKGSSLELAMAEIGQAVEGVTTLKIVHKKAKELSVYMPLATALHAILFEQQNLQKVISELMTGGLNQDVDL